MKRPASGDNEHALLHATTAHDRILWLPVLAWRVGLLGAGIQRVDVAVWLDDGIGHFERTERTPFYSTWWYCPARVVCDDTALPSAATAGAPLPGVALRNITRQAWLRMATRGAGKAATVPLFLRARERRTSCALFCVWRPLPCLSCRLRDCAFLSLLRGTWFSAGLCAHACGFVRLRSHSSRLFQPAGVRAAPGGRAATSRVGAGTG